MPKEKVLTPWGEDARDCARTPDHIFEAASEDAGGFDVDAAADAQSARGPVYWDIVTNGLLQDWSRLSIWCNPPYSNIAPWIEKAATARKAALLLPVRSDRIWWRRLVETATYLDFYAGRIQFNPYPGIVFSQNREYSVLAVFDDALIKGLCRVRSAATGRLISR